MTDFGMAFGQRGLLDPDYTTDRQRLQVDLNNFTKLFDVITVPAGTNATVVSGPTAIFKENLFELEHGLGYIPQVYVAFQLLPKAGGAPLYYAINLVLLAEGGDGSDLITYDINEQFFTINHVMDATEGGIGDVIVSTAGNYEIKVKYLICNNKQIQTQNIQ